MPGGNRVIRSERELVPIGDWSIDVETTDRVWSIQNKHRQLRLRTLFKQVAKCGTVSPEAYADVLNVKHERVEIFELLGLGPARLAVQRIDTVSYTHLTLPTSDL